MILIEIIYYLGLIACFVPLAVRFSGSSTSTQIERFHDQYWSLSEVSFRTITDWWSWCESSLIPKRYDPADSITELVEVLGASTRIFESNPFPITSTPHVLGGSGMVLVGPLRMRQLRVNEGNCSDDFEFRSLSRFCGSGYNFKDTDNIQTFSQPQTPAYLRGAFSYSTEGDVSSVIQSTRTKISYPSGGFIQDLPSDKQHAIEMLADLRKASWVDHLTAAVVVEMTVYYPSLKFFAVDQILFEFPESGIMETSHYVESFPSFSVSFVSASPADMAINVLAIILQIAGIASLVVTLWKVRRRFFLLIWNSFDLVMLSVAFVYMGLRISLLKINPGESFGDPNEFMPLASFIPTKRVALQLQTTLLALMFVRSFKFTLIFPIRIARAIRDCFITLLGVMIICGCVIIGMSLGLHLAVGFRDNVYSFITDAFAAVTLSFLNVVWVTGVTGIGAFINLWFVWLIYLIAIPLVVAIAADAWTKARPEPRKTHPLAVVLHTWFDRIRRRPVVETIEVVEVDLSMFPTIIRNRIQERRKQTRIRVENEFGYFPAEYSEYHGKVDTVELQRALNEDPFFAKVLGSSSAIEVIQKLKEENSLDTIQAAIDRKMDVLQREQLNLGLRVDPRIDVISAEIQETLTKFKTAAQADVHEILELVQHLSRSLDQVLKSHRLSNQKLK